MPAGPDPVVVRGHALFQYENEEGDLEWLIRKDNCMHCAAGLPEGLPVARCHRAVRQRHRRLQFRALHRLRLLRGRVPLQHPAHLEEGQQGLQVHALFRPRLSRPGAGLREELPDRLDPVRHQGADARLRRASGRKLKERGFENAGIYDPAGVGGTHVVYVLQHADKPEIYSGLPKDPHISPTVEL